MAEEFVMMAVTPEMAQTWLNNNNFDRQRSLREHHIFTLAEEMEGGNFIPHSAIVFARLDKQDFLIDGQHRLNAVMLHGKPVNLPILTKIAANLEQVARWYASIDQGLKRSARDAIKAQNLHEELGVSERHAGRLSAAVKLIASGFQEVGKGQALRVAGRSNIVVSDLMRDWAAESKQYYELIAGGEAANLYLFDRAAVIACALLTLRYQQEKAATFWRGISQDDGLKREDPRKRLLMWLGLNKEKPTLTARAFAVAWRAWMDGREIEMIRFKTNLPIKIEGIPLDDVTRKSGIASAKLESWREVRAETRSHAEAQSSPA